MPTAEPARVHVPPKRRVYLLAAALVLAGIAAYANSLGGAFVLDDRTHIVNNPALVRGGPLAALSDARPLVALSLWFNHALGRALGGDGLDPLGYHVFNLAVHLIAGLALFGLVRRSAGRAKPQAAGIAFAIALLWLVHPLTTQAVTYVIQRGESMMAMFFLLSIYCLARGGPGDRKGWLAAAVAAAWLSGLSKQVAVVLPAVLLLYDRAFVAGTLGAALRRRWWVYALGSLGSLALLGAAAAGAMGDEQTAAGFGMQRLSPWAYALTQPGVILHYLRLCFWPAPLVFDYGWPVATGFWRIAPPLVALVLLLGATGAALWRRPRVGFVAASFFLVLAPTSSIMPIADMAAEHRMYLPLAAVVTLAVLAAAWALRRAAGRRWGPIGAAMVAGAALALGSATFLRNGDYHDPARLWRDTIAHRPHNPRAYHNLANVLFSRGQIEQATAAYRRAIELEPGDAQARVNLGVALLQLGEADAARAAFQGALGVWPEFAPALNQLGILRAKAQDLDAAAALFRRAIAADPAFADGYVGLGNVCFARGASAQAAAAYREALRLRAVFPGSARVHNNLGVSLAQMGRLSQAADQFAAAVRQDPSFADARANLRQAREMLRRPGP